MARVGERVGAILSGSDREVQFLGFGVYAGRPLRPNWRQEAAMYVEAQTELNAAAARQTVADWLKYHRAENDWMRDRAPEQVRDDDEIRQMAERSYREAQERLAWTSEQVLEYLKTSGLLGNPCIRLDSGDEVWGMECWWGSEENVRRQLAQWEKSGAKIVDVRLDPDRWTAA
jgi:hypothetical protein